MIDENAPAISGLAFRQYRGPADLQAIHEVLMAGRKADGVNWLPSLQELVNEFEHLVNEDPVRDLIVAEVAGRPVAFVRASWAIRDGSLQYHTSGEVHPDVRRRGLGRTLLRAAQDHLRTIAANEGHASTPDASFTSETMQGETGARALLAADGYRPIRYFVEMLRPLDVPIPDQALPPGLEMRPVVADDHRRIFEAEAEAFHDHWGYRDWTEADYVRTFSGPDLDTSLWRVVWDGDQVAAVTETCIHVEENAALGVQHAWLERVSTRRAWRGRGLAKAMLVETMRVAKGRGMTHAALGVDAANPSGAFGLYEGLGFSVASQMEVVGRPFDR